MSKRVALIVTASEFLDPKLANLRSTSIDDASLTAVLSDKSIGDYEVTHVVNHKYHEIGERTGAFLKDRHPTDTVLLYFSSHGLKNHDGELFIAGIDTKLAQFEDMSLPASHLARQIERCRAQSIVLLLDCCYAGAFPSDANPKSAGDAVDLRELIGDGRVVITASSSTEYAFEGTSVKSEEPAASVFTQAVVLGLQSGDADVDKDGIVSPADLFAYVQDSLRDSYPQQTPMMHAARLRGKIAVAHNRHVEDLATSSQTALPARRARSQSHPDPPDVHLLRDIMEDVLNQIEAVDEHQNLSRNPGFVATGLEELDALTGGYRTGELTLITGESGAGKSTLALNAVRRSAITSGRPCLLAALESNKTETTNKLLAAEGRVPIHHMQRGMMLDESWAKLARVMGEVSEAPIYIFDQPPATLQTFSRLVASKHDLVLVVVDNLQMITEVTGPSGLVAATRALKLMAQEFNVAVVATVLQEAELSTENSPIGAIDRYADLVIEISRYDDTDPRSPNSRIGEADLHVVRNRRGVNGTVIVAFQGHYGRFVDFGSGPPVPAPSIDPTPPDDAEPES